MRNSSSRSGQSVDVLLVEDNPGDVRLMKEAFKEARLVNTLHVVVDGDEALDFVYQRNEYTDAPHPDLVLLDWNLPSTNGEDVLAELKGDEDLRSIYVIIMTGSQTHKDEAKSSEMEANTYITKPVEPDEFLNTICSFGDFWLNIVRLPPENDRDEPASPAD